MNTLSYYCAAPFALAAALSAALSFNSSDDGAAAASPAGTPATVQNPAEAPRDAAGGGFLDGLFGGGEPPAELEGYSEDDLQRVFEGLAEEVDRWASDQGTEPGWGAQGHGGNWGGGGWGAHSGGGGIDHAALQRHRQQMQMNQAQFEQRNLQWQIDQARNDAAHNAFIQSIRQ